MKTYITKNDGFSLLEVTIAVAISGIVVAGSVYFIGSFTKDSNKLTKSVAISLTKGTIAGTFGQVAERAGVSAAFMHLPIKNNSNCSYTDPCVRSWSEATKKFSEGNDSFPLSYDTIEFFRDSSGELIESPVNATSSSFPNVYLKTSESFIWDPASALGREYYVTWPLINETSKAFPLMVSLESADYFTILPDWILSNSLAPKEDIIKGLNNTSVFDDPEKTMKDRLYLIFSPTNLRSFFLRTISTVTACKNSSCNALFTAIKGSGTSLPSNLYTDHHYKVLFSPLAITSNLYNFFPRLDYIASSNTWRGQGDFFYFPTNNFSLIQNPLTHDDFKPDGDARLKGIGHFLGEVGSSNFVISPVGFAFFFLIKGEMIKREKSSVKDQSYQLVLRKYNTTTAFNDVVVASDIIGKVYIVRKIGNGSLSIVIEK